MYATLPSSSTNNRVLSGIVADVLYCCAIQSFNSSALSRGILEVFLGANTLSPTIRIAAGQGAMKLLDSDKVRREYLHRSILTEQDYKNPQYYKNKDKKKPE